MAGSVGLGIHLLHKKAYADVDRTAHLEWNDMFIEGVDIKIVCGASSIRDFTDVNGDVVLIGCPAAQNWIIIDMDDDWDFVEGTPINVSGEFVFRLVPIIPAE